MKVIGNRFLVFVFGVAISTGFPVYAGQSQSIETVDAGEIPVENNKGSAGYTDRNYIGTWLRQGVYVDGRLQNQTPATLVYTKDKFNASGMCRTAGTIQVSGATIKTVMTQSDCPGGVKPPFTIVYKYTISDNGKKLTLVFGPVKEIYIRK